MGQISTGYGSLVSVPQRHLSEPSGYGNTGKINGNLLNGGTRLTTAVHMAASHSHFQCGTRSIAACTVRFV